MSETANGNKYILSIVDNFSKYAITYATAKQDTQTVIECLTKLFAEFGVPNKILSNQGRMFVSKTFLDFCALWNAKKITSTSYHPQTQGLVERFNGTVIRILKRYVYKTQEKWDISLPYATYAYNTTEQKTNGVTPYEVLFGKKANTLLLDILKPKDSDYTISEYIAKLKTEINKISEIVTQRQNKVRNAEKDKYDKKAKGQCFAVGDRVLLFNPAIKLGQNKKFAPSYVGPFTITEQLNETNFEIEPDEQNEKTQIVHQNRLKRYKGDKKTTNDKQATVTNNDNNETGPVNNNIPDTGNDTDSSDSDDENNVQTHTEETIQTNNDTRDNRNIDNIQNKSPEISNNKKAKQYNDNTPINNNETDEELNNTGTRYGAKEKDSEQSDPSYRQQHSLSPPIPRRNPERNRRAPTRLGSIGPQVNTITIDDTHYTIRTRTRQPGGNFKWNLLKIYVWAVMIGIINGEDYDYKKERWEVETKAPVDIVKPWKKSSIIFNSSETLAN